MKIFVGNIQSEIEYDIEKMEYVRCYRKLREFMSCNYAGSYWMKKNEKKFNGKRYFLTEKSKFATGFLPSILKWLDESGIDVEIIDQRKNFIEFREPIERVLPNGWLLTGERAYQGDCVDLATSNTIRVGGNEVYFPRGLVMAATNWGKQTFNVSVIQNSLNNAKWLFLCRGDVTYREALKFYKENFGNQVTEVNSSEMDFSGRIVIAMQKTLFNRAQKDMRVRVALGKINGLIVDECHEAGGTEFSRLITWINAYAKFFVSGTVQEVANPVKRLVISGCSGGILYKGTNDEMIKKGISLRPIIHVYLNDESVTHKNYEIAYSESVIYSEKRAKLILDEVLKAPKERTYISFNIREHGRFLYEYFCKNAPQLINRIDWTHGLDKERHEKIERFKRGELDILICSLILKQSANIPDMRKLILAQGGKSKINVKQLVGRLIRNDGKNTTVDVVDFFDDSKWLSDHSVKRVNTYRKEGFEIVFHYSASIFGRPKKG